MLHAPTGYLDTLGSLPAGVRLLGNRAADLDFVHLFARTRTDLERRFAAAAARLKPNGMLWVSWPKQTSPLAADLNENIVREIGLEAGLVDVKVAAIDYDWSGLKFVYRLKDRPSSAWPRS